MPNLEPNAEPHAGHDDEKKDDVEGHGLSAEPREPHAGETDEETDDVEAHGLIAQPNQGQPNQG
jgi:hypothetical protein